MAKKKSAASIAIRAQRLEAALKEVSAALAALQAELSALPQQQFCPFPHNPLYCPLPHYPCTRPHMYYTWITPNAGTIISGKVASGAYHIQANGNTSLALDVIGSRAKDS